MRFEDVAQAVEGVLHMPPRYGRTIYDFLRETGKRDILELGFAHGVSACYMAAALEESGGGRIVTIDNESARRRRPTIDELLARTGLERYVEPVFAERSYNWELMKLVERQTVEGVCQPAFDFCYIDGAHTWEIDGLAFFLADKLLRPGGWLLLDDFDWRFIDSPSRDQPEVRALPEEERTTAQIRKVYELLVIQHPDYDSYRVTDDNWAWARKKPDARSSSHPDLEAILARQSIRADVVSLGRKIARRTKRRLVRRRT